MRILGGFLVGLLVGAMLVSGGYALAQVQPKKEPKVHLVRIVDKEAGMICYTVTGLTLTGAAGISCLAGPSLGSLPKTKLIPID